MTSTYEVIGAALRPWRSGLTLYLHLYSWNVTWDLDSNRHSVTIPQINKYTENENLVC